MSYSGMNIVKNNNDGILIYYYSIGISPIIIKLYWFIYVSVY